jgi:hypothetical protein
VDAVAAHEPVALAGPVHDVDVAAGHLADDLVLGVGAGAVDGGDVDLGAARRLLDLLMDWRSCAALPSLVPASKTMRL